MANYGILGPYKMKHKRLELQNGQVWQVRDSNIQIQLVGKRLVHYKLFKGKTKRPAVSVSGKDVVEGYLKEHKATLVRA